MLPNYISPLLIITPPSPLDITPPSPPYLKRGSNEGALPRGGREGLIRIRKALKRGDPVLCYHVLRLYDNFPVIT